MKRARVTATALGLGLVLAPLTLLPARVITPPAQAAVSASNQASQLAQAIAGPGAVVTGATWELPGGTPPVNANGIGTGAQSEFPTHGDGFAVLTNGHAADANGPNDNGVDDENDLSTVHDQGGAPPDEPPPLAATRGEAAWDVSVLAVDLDVPATANCLTFDFKFFSEEFFEFVEDPNDPSDFGHNDAFVAELDVTDWRAEKAATIDAPNNFAFDPYGKEVSVNSTGLGTATLAHASGTPYDGATPLLNAASPVTPGLRTVYFSIFDHRDSIIDAAVFLDNLRVGWVDDPAEHCVAGAAVKTADFSASPATADLTVGDDHTVDLQFTDLGAVIDPSAPPPSPTTLLVEIHGANAHGPVPIDTNIAGEASYSWTGVNAGTDTLTACADLDDSGTCEPDEPVTSATATFAATGPIEQPRLAFTDEKDAVYSTEVTRIPDTEGGEFYGRDGLESLRAPRDWRKAPDHEGEASTRGDYTTYVSSTDHPAGEVYEHVKGTDTRITCDTDRQTHPVRNGQRQIAFASDADGDWDIYVASPPPDEVERVAPAWALKKGAALRRTPTAVAPAAVPAPAPTACLEEWTIEKVTEDPDPPAETPDLRYDDLWPAWTADGDLVFSSTREPTFEAPDPAPAHPLPDLWHAIELSGGWSLERLTDTPDGAETQPTVAELSNAEGVEASCCPPECSDDWETDTWVAFTSTEWRADGSIAVLSLDAPTPTPTSIWGGPVRQGSEPAWSGCEQQPHLAFTSTEDDPYGDVWIARMAVDSETDRVLVPPRADDASAVVSQRGVAETHPTWADAFGSNEDEDPDHDGGLTFTSRARNYGFDGGEVRFLDADVSDVRSTDGTQRRVLRRDTEIFDGRVTHRLDEAGPSYSPDGTRIVYSTDPVYDESDSGMARKLMMANSDGSDAAELMPDGQRDVEDFDTDPVWSPDGTKVAFVRLRSGEEDQNASVWVYDLTTKVATEVGTATDPEQSEPPDVNDLHPSWSPDSRKLVVSRGFQLEPGSSQDGARRASIGDFTTPELWVLDALDPAVLPRPLAVPSPCPGFTTAAADCTFNVTGREPAWSPDGTQVAFVRLGALRLLTLDPAYADTLGPWEVSEPVAITGFKGSIGLGAPTESRDRIATADDPAWSVDGSEIAFSGQPVGQPDLRGIHAIAPDGTGLRLITDELGPETEPAWQQNRADVAVAVGITGSPALPGEPVTATYTITNLGPGVAKNVVLTTTFTAGATTSSAAPPPGCAADGSGCTLPTLEPGASVVYVVTITHAAPVDGTATGTVTTGTHDPNATNDSSTAPYDIQEADLSVTVSVSPTPTLVNTDLVATYTVTNDGREPATDATLSTTITAGGSPTAIAPPAGCFADGSGCVFGTLGVGESRSYQVRLSYPVAVNGTAAGTVASTTLDPDLADNEDSAPFIVYTVPVDPGDRADLVVTVEIDEPVGYVGGFRTASVAILNRGPDAATDVGVQVDWPDFVTPQAAGFTPVCLAAGDPCPIGTLEPGEGKGFTVLLETMEVGTGEAVATITGATTDPRPANNEDRAALEVVQPTIRLLPAVARPGQVVLAYGENMPPRTQVRIRWAQGITVNPGTVTVRDDGTVSFPMLVVRRDLLGVRQAEASSPEGYFDPVTGDLLVTLRLMTPPQFVGRG